MFRVLAKGRWKSFHFHCNLGQDKNASLPYLAALESLLLIRFMNNEGITLTTGNSYSRQKRQYLVTP